MQKMKSSKGKSLKLTKKTADMLPHVGRWEANRSSDAYDEASALQGLLATLLASNSDPVFSVDTGYRYTSFNSAHAAAMKSLYGVKIEIGQCILEQMSVQVDRQIAKSNLDRALSGEHLQEEAHAGESERIRRHFTVGHFPIRGSDGKVRGVLVTARDTTDLHDSEVNLQISVDRLACLVESGVIGVLVADANGAVLEANDYYLRLVGYTRQELVDGKLDWRSLTPPEHLQTDTKAIEELVATGICQPYEKEYLRRDGTRVWVELADAYLGGSDQLIVATTRDISQRKAAERDLLESEARYRLLHNHAGFAIIFYSPDGVILMINVIASRYLKGCPEDFEGKHCTEVFGDVMGTQVLSQIAFATDSSIPVDSEWEAEFPTGKRWLRTIYCSIRSSAGELIGVQVIAEDVTDLRLKGFQLQEHVDQIEKDRTALEHKQNALVEVMDLMRQEHDRIAHRISVNFEITVRPLLAHLKIHAGKPLEGTISALEQAISDILSPFTQELSREFSALTPRELEVCDLLRKGRSSKEIEAVLDISLLTVHKLRQRIRSKLHITNLDTDLGTYLRSLKPPAKSS
jgi:PAS domain S-box-containing protein